MTSIFERALGSDFANLHPMVQRRFGLSSARGLASIGSGRMTEIWHGPTVVRPFLALGARRRILVPEHGRDVPFTIENYPFVDDLGRETVSMIRTFELPGVVRRFDAWMIWSDSRARIVDYLGSHEHLAADIDLRVDPEGGLCLRSGGQHCRVGPVRTPWPLTLSGIADVREWYDDAAAVFRIVVDVRNRAIGPLFGYRGWFQAAWLPVGSDGVPAHVMPRRTEAAE